MNRTWNYPYSRQASSRDESPPSEIDMNDALDFPLGRFERKYLVSDEVAAAIKEAIAPHVVADEHMPSENPRGYVVHTLYLDSPTLELYRWTRESRVNRYKLRLRFYDEHATSRIYAEIKEKRSGQTFKRRYGMDHELAQAMMADRTAEPLVHALGNGAASTALAEFCELRYSIAADPKLFVTYQREAYNSQEEPQVRITFDRRMRTNAFGRSGGLAVPKYGVNIGGRDALLEFKYADDPPAWLKETLDKFNLRRAKFSKFAESVDALGISGRSPRKFKVTQLR
jgi:hypothetical protein